MNQESFALGAFEAALKFHKNGVLDKAETLYQEVLLNQSEHAGALHMLGVLRIQTGRAHAAIALLERAKQYHLHNAVFFFNLGAAYYATNEIEKAIEHYQIALSLHPEYVDALRQCGKLLHTAGSIDKAEAMYRHLISIHPDADDYNNLAVILKSARRLEEAAVHFQYALSLNPQAIYIYRNLGVVLHDLGRFDEAIAHFRHVLTLSPQYAQAHENLGISLKAAGRLDDAIASFRVASTFDPASASALTNLGHALSDQGKFAEAAECYRHALAITPDFVEAHNNLGNVLTIQGLFEEAILHFHQAISKAPNNASAYANLASALRNMKHFDEAVDACKKAINIAPELAVAYNTLGALLTDQEKFIESETICRKAISLVPGYGLAYFNLGNSLRSQKRYREASEAFHLAFQFDTGLDAARFNFALTELATGRYETGLPYFEYRWKLPEYQKNYRSFTQPLWLGDVPLSGKTILLHAEEGLGDTLQMVRYIECAANLGACIYLEVQPPLKSLLATLSHVQGIFAEGELLPDYDFHCPLMSLPLALGTTVDNYPKRSPYLQAHATLVDQLSLDLQKYREIRVGLCWKGSTLYSLDKERSPGLQYFEDILHMHGVHSFSLLPNSRNEFCQQGTNAVDLGRDLDSATAPFQETAALMMNLDLVITSDTSIAHLAGALGRPVWLVLSHVPDWRWMIDRTDTIWYPNTRLFRQSIRGDWAEVFKQVTSRLEGVVNGMTPILGEA